MAFPVIGRGRVLYALVGKGNFEDTIAMASRFVVGPCSCQVKDQNPGFDLLMNVDWDEKIGGSLVSEEASRERSKPIFIPNPIGKAVVQFVSKTEPRMISMRIKIVFLVLAWLLAPMALVRPCFAQESTGSDGGLPRSADDGMPPNRRCLRSRVKPRGMRVAVRLSFRRRRVLVCRVTKWDARRRCRPRLVADSVQRKLPR